MRFSFILAAFFFVNLASATAQMVDQELYLFDEFQDAQINFIDRGISKQKVNYNFFYNDLCFLDAPTDMVLIAQNVNQIANILIDGRTFIMDGKKFIEIINDSPLVHVQYRKSIRRASQGAYGSMTETSAVDSYKQDKNNTWRRNEFDISNMKIGSLEHIYSIDKAGGMKQFRSSRQFQNLYPDHKNEIKQYIKNNSIDFDEPEKVIELIKYAESL